MNPRIRLYGAEAWGPLICIEASRFAATGPAAATDTVEVDLPTPAPEPSPPLIGPDDH
jgi:hypothetical protein